MFIEASTAKKTVNKATEDILIWRPTYSGDSIIQLRVVPPTEAWKRWMSGVSSGIERDPSRRERLLRWMRTLELMSFFLTFLADVNSEAGLGEVYRRWKDLWS